MSDEHIRVYFQTIRRKITAFLGGDQTALPELNTALEELQSLYEQIQANLEVAEITAESWLEENQYIASSCQHYYDLFQLAPIAYLVTNAAGIIQEANQATAQLLNADQDDLAGQPLILYVAERDRLNFRLKLRQLPQTRGIQAWQLTLCPQIDLPFTAELSIVPIRNDAGELEELRVGVYNVSYFQRKVNQLLHQRIIEEIQVREAQTKDGTTQEPPTPEIHAREI